MKMETKVSDELLKHLEGLAKLELLEDERIELKKDIEEILQYMTLLDGVDPDAEEMVTPVEKSLEPREDELVEFKESRLIRDLFPDTEGSYLKVPRIYKEEK
ncbi:Glutamyl-tRNA(Gln) amidotransferase subunit C [Mesotoga infera]|jgi:aspartyl-tRNA(Asn)/glutamyl-tRNA(Gln) amidotransferase subunit C|nr:Glutamyl-tRNA(Gln) amidotransferase subunit C [Mesotoga infera]